MCVCVCVCVCVFFHIEWTDRASTISSNIRVCQSGTCSQRGTKVNGLYHGDNSLLKPIEILIAIKSLLGPTTRGHRELVRVKKLSLDTNYSFCCLKCGQYLRVV